MASRLITILLSVGPVLAFAGDDHGRSVQQGRSPDGVQGPEAITARFALPAGQEGRTLFWGIKRDGRLLARGRLVIPETPGDAIETALPFPKGTSVPDGRATLHLCINRDGFESYIPSFGDLYRELAIEVAKGRGDVAASAEAWREHTLSRPENRLTIYYHRYDGDYQAVGIWTWDERLERTPQRNEVFAVGHDDFGLIFQLDTANYGRPGDRIGLLPRMNGDWSFKDGGDRYWSPDLGSEIYLVEGSDTVYKAKPEVSPKLVGATLDGPRTVTLRFTHSLAPIPADQVAIRSDTGAGVPIAEVVSRRPSVDGRTRTFAVRLAAEPDITRHALQVEVRGFAARPVRLGRILRGDRFFDPQTPLGATYSPEATTFGVFSPMAEAVEVVIAKSPTAGALETPPERWRGGVSKGTGPVKFPLTRNRRGVWSVTVPGDLKGRFYAYQLRGPGLDPHQETTDIYATCAQGVTGRAMIVDLDETDPPGFHPPRYVVLDSPTDAIIYEMHVRDFTIAPNSGVSSKAKYTGLAEPGTRLEGDPAVKTGLDHLLELGVTHVQLMPVQDFENAEDEDALYNWGYIPMFFNSPEGWFASTPRGDARIRELKQAVQALHERGIGVILDVVYNHTSRRATFDRIAPGYYFRVKADGSYWDGSGCGNEVCTENPMVRRFIVDSVRYWVSEFGIDGFRFDLMGLMDLKTLKTIRDELSRINPSVLLYGEPWAGGPSGLRKITDKSVIRGTGIGAFNDHFRDAIKGDRNGGAPGFIQAGDRIDAIRHGILGAIDDWAIDPADVITYCACHDNLTTWDKIVQSAVDAPNEVKKRMQRFAGLLVLTSQGTAFLHGGQEFCRSKGGNHNSYNAPDDVNRIDWSLKKANRDVFEYYRGLIAMRKAHPVFRLRTRQEVERRLRFLDGVPGDRCLAYTLDGSGLAGESWSTTLVLLNGESRDLSFELPPGRWLVAADADQVSERALAEATGSLNVLAHSGMVLHK